MTWLKRHPVALFAAILVLGISLRLTGFDRGFDDGGFHVFHPDEATVLRAALQLQTPLSPPLTAYGLLPLYLARAGLATAALTPEAVAADGWPAYRVLRLLSLLLAAGTLAGIWALTRRLFDVPTAALAAGLFAVAPVAVQQGHFFTVDGVFLLCVTWALLAIARVETPGSLRSGMVVGVLIGLAAATRLNGLLLIPVALTAIWLPRGTVTATMRRDALLYPLAVVGAALTVTIALQPYLVMSPELMWQDRSSDDFWFSARIASGERLRLWSLYDLHTTPWLHYLTDLLPLAVGWPLALASLAGVALAARQWRSPLAPLLLWAGLFFLVMGGLHTKHVRYLLPLLPALLPLAALLMMRGWRLLQWRRLSRATVLATVVFTAIYGIAFTRIYQVPDSRIEAMRWLRDRVPAGTSVGLETGGFSLRGLVGDADFDVRDIDVASLFHLRGHLSCGAAAEHLLQQVDDMSYVTLVDVNRQAQVTAAPDMLPATASFYHALQDESLGFERVAHFKTTPALGVRFHDDGAEPSFLGYDHPAVSIYQRQAGATAALQRWRDSVDAGTCPDAALAEAVVRAEAGDTGSALQSVTTVTSGQRAAQAAWLLAADIHRRHGDAVGDEAAFQRYQEGFYGADQAHLIPWATSLTLTRAGAPDLALTGLMAGVLHVRSAPTPLFVRHEMADSYLQAADVLADNGRDAHALRARQMAAELTGTASLKQ